MNKYIHIVEQFKTLLGMASQLKMEEVTLKDGTIVSVDKMEVGGVVTLPDGSFAPMGDYETQDSMKITVGEAGVITAIEPYTEETEVEVEITASTEDRLAELEKAVSMITETLSTVLEMSKTSLSNQKSIQERLDKSTNAKPLPETGKSTNLSSVPSKKEILEQFKQINRKNN